MRPVLKGSTDQSVVIRIVDEIDGTAETGVVAATTGLDLRYRRELEATVALTESDLAALTTAHADGGIKHILAGYYRVDVPDAAFATGADGVWVGGTCTGMFIIGAYVPLVAYNPQDTVRLGLTALPNAAATAAGGLPVSTAGALNMDAGMAAAVSADITATAIKVDTAAILIDTGTTLDAAIATMQTAVTAIKAKTDALVIAAGRVDVDVKAVNANTGVPAIMERAFEAEVLVTIGVGSTTTSLVTSSMDPAAVVTDQYRGRIFIFSKQTTTTQLRGQGGRITAMTSGGVLSFDVLQPFSTSAANGDIGGIF